MKVALIFIVSLLINPIFVYTQELKIQTPSPSISIGDDLVIENNQGFTLDEEQLKALRIILSKSKGQSVPVKNSKNRVIAYILSINEKGEIEIEQALKRN